MYKLTGIYWIRNEARYLPEYLEFHLLQGFDHFVFWQDGDTDNTAEILEPYINEGLVEYKIIPEYITQKKNFGIMSLCIEQYRDISKWIHFHAIDERLFNPAGLQLPAVLEEFDRPDISGIATNWIQLHSGGKEKMSSDLLINQFTIGQSQDPMRHVKTLIRPDRINPYIIHTPHNFSPISGTRIVNEVFEDISGPFNYGNYSTDKLRNFHYATLSKEEYETKMSKGVLDGINTTGYRRADADFYWEYYHNNGNVVYTDLLKWGPQVREKIIDRFKKKESLLQYVNH